MDNLTNIIDENSVERLIHTATVDGKIWLAGGSTLSVKSPVMIILPYPFRDDIEQIKILADSAWGRLKQMCKLAKLDLDTCYITYGLKYLPAKKKPTQKEYNTCKACLLDEIHRLQPKVIVPMGAEVVKLLFGAKSNITQFEGGFTSYEGYDNIVFMPLYSPSYVTRYPEAEGKYISALEKLASNNLPATLDKNIEYTLIDTIDKLKEMVDSILDDGGDILALDCEWQGLRACDPDAKIRTVQLKRMSGTIYVIEPAIYCKDSEDNYSMVDCMDPILAYSEIKRLLEHPSIKLIGHNIREDGHWLAKHGINIRPNTVYDTMIAEHCMNSLGPFGLEVLTCKYTTLGRYDIPLSLWKNENKKLVTNGYGFIPADILHPYGAYDVEATMRIFEAQQVPLNQYMEKRGEYPSLFHTAMYVADLLYELEDTGMLVDREQLNNMTKQYHDKKSKLETQLKDEAKTRFGLEDFNHDSSPQRQEALFTHLKLSPVMSTSGKEWAWVVNQTPLVQKQHSPATNKMTLEILKHSDPFVELLLNTRRISTVCKNFLRNDEEGGIPGNIWPDGRIHARFSQLAETGRFRHSKPNVANFPKSAEGYIGKIFSDEDSAPDDIRSIIVSDPGYTFVEADFVQAELFVLASLANDSVMMSALTTPGKDLHDMTAISAFRMKVLYPDGSEVKEGELERLATEYPKQFKDELLPQLIYIKADGTRLTRDQFKKGIRVSAKAINFGCKTSK